MVYFKVYFLAPFLHKNCLGREDDDQAISNLPQPLSSLSKEKRPSGQKNILFQCKPGEVIPSFLVNDSIPDCFEGHDENDFFEVRKRHTLHHGTCRDLMMIPCFPGDRRCFPIFKYCLYELHDGLGQGFLQTCRNGRHLENCSSYECSYQFKCHSYYCVPWAYLCDGKSDCPLLNDEEDCSKRNCLHMFRCKQSLVCIHLNDMCNGRTDCVHGEDELLCDLPSCPRSCSCFQYAMSCSSADFQFSTLVDVPFRYVKGMSRWHVEMSRWMAMYHEV